MTKREYAFKLLERYNRYGDKKAFDKATRLFLDLLIEDVEKLKGYIKGK
jgi:hypothetical protein